LWQGGADVVDRPFGGNAECERDPVSITVAIELENPATLLSIKDKAIRGAGEAVRTAENAGKPLVRRFGKGLAQPPDAVEGWLSVATNRVLLAVAEDLRRDFVERALRATILDIDADSAEVRHRCDHYMAAMVGSSM